MPRGRPRTNPLVTAVKSRKPTPHPKDKDATLKQLQRQQLQILGKRKRTNITQQLNGNDAANGSKKPSPVLKRGRKPNNHHCMLSRSIQTSIVKSDSDSFGTDSSFEDDHTPSSSSEHSSDEEYLDADFHQKYLENEYNGDHEEIKEPLRRSSLVPQIRSQPMTKPHEEDQ